MTRSERGGVISHVGQVKGDCCGSVGGQRLNSGISDVIGGVLTDIDHVTRYDVTPHRTRDLFKPMSSLARG